MKKMMKRASALLLALALVLGLCACGAAGTPAAPVDTKPQDAGEVPTQNEEIVTLKIWGFDYTSTSEDLAMVSEAVSAITREKIGVNVEITRQGDGEMLNLALLSGEQWDLVNYHTYSGGLSALVNNGLAMPIDDLMAEYGQDAVAVIGEKMLRAGRVNGVQYSIPSFNVWANGYGMAVSLDILEELNIDPESLKTWDDLHDAFVKMKEAHPDMYPVVTAWGGGGMQKTFAWDNLGTGFWDGLGILENATDGSTTVVNMYETDSYREFCEMMYQWKQEGLLMPDATTTTSNTVDLIGTVGYASFENITPTRRQELLSGNYWGDGKRGVAIEVIPPFIPSDAGGSSFFIPTTCAHPEKAMQLWNLMYTDKEIANILTYGIEGRDYEFTDDTKTVVHRNQESTYGYLPWTWPNRALPTIIEGVDANIWEEIDKFHASAPVSPVLGFKFDSSAVMNEITACNNVIAKYEVGLRWGELDPAEALPKFNEELYAAGLQTIIDAKQEQLDAFLGK